MTIINLCTSSGHAFYFTKFCKIISNGIKVIVRTHFYTKEITKGNNSAKNVIGGETVVKSLHVVLSCFKFVQSFMKLSRTVSKLWTGHE